jgi:hypothetical protein
MTALVDGIAGLALGAALIPIAGYAIMPAWKAVSGLFGRKDATGH